MTMRNGKDRRAVTPRGAGRTSRTEGREGVNDVVQDEPVLELRGVSKTYEAKTGPQQVLREVDLAVARGEVVALVGPSGSGKSTLLGIAGLLLDPTSGEIRLAGRSAAGLSASEQTRMRGRTIGFLFQEATLTAHLTAVENVLLPLLADRTSADPRVARALLDRVGLAEHADKLPAALSGGQAQRVALCRALVREPELILADEPTASLDAAAADNVRDELRRIAATGVGVVVATHDPATVACADRAVVLTDGHLTDAEPLTHGIATS